MMIKVHACGKTREYPEGTPLFTVAEEFQPEFQEDILLARVNGKLKELHKTLTKESQIEFLTFQDPVPLLLSFRSRTLPSSQDEVFPV